MLIVCILIAISSIRKHIFYWIVSSLTCKILTAWVNEDRKQHVCYSTYRLLITQMIRWSKAFLMSGINDFLSNYFLKPVSWEAESTIEFLLQIWATNCHVWRGCKKTFWLRKLHRIKNYIRFNFDALCQSAELRTSPFWLSNEEIIR